MHTMFFDEFKKASQFRVRRGSKALAPNRRGVQPKLDLPCLSTWLCLTATCSHSPGSMLSVSQAVIRSTLRGCVHTGPSDHPEVFKSWTPTLGISRRIHTLATSQAGTRSCPLSYVVEAIAAARLHVSGQQ